MPPTSDAPLALTVGFDHLYGLQITETGDAVMRGSVIVRDKIKQPAGLVHGGVYASIAESLATTGSALAVHAQGETAVCLSTQTSFLRPITQGQIDAVARARHRGRTTWVWEVELSDEAGRLCVLIRVTVKISPGDQVGADLSSR